MKMKIATFKYYEVEIPNSYDRLAELTNMESGTQTKEEIKEESDLRFQLMKDIEKALPGVQCWGNETEEYNVEYISLVEDETGNCLIEF